MVEKKKHFFIADNWKKLQKNAGFRVPEVENFTVPKYYVKKSLLSDLMYVKIYYFTGLLDAQAKLVCFLHRYKIDSVLLCFNMVRPR